MGSLSLTLRKYYNESYEDSERSKQALRQRVEFGLGNETKNTLEKSDFDLMTKRLQRAHFLSPEERVEMSDDGIVFLPSSLLNKTGLQVMIADKLKSFVKTSADGRTLMLPATIDWRFLQANRTQGTTAVLNIGGKTNENMQILTTQNLKDYLGEKDYLLEQQKKQIQSAFEAIKQQHSELSKLSISFDNNQIAFFQGDKQI